MKHDHFISIASIVGLVILVIMLCFSSPSDVGPVGVLLFFTTVYVVIFGLSTKLYQLFLRLALKRKRFRTKDYLYCAVFAFGPIMLLLSRSLGSVTPVTALLIVLVISLLEFLVAKRT